MKKERNKSNSETEDIEEIFSDPLSLVCRVSIIAVRADDDRFPYYLLKAASGVYETKDKRVDRQHFRGKRQSRHQRALF